MENSRPDALSAALHAAPIGAAIIGADGLIRSWNRRAETVTGWPANKAIGHPDPSIPAEARAGAATSLAQLLSQPSSARRVVADRVRPDGTTVSVTLLGLEPVELDDGPGLAVWFDEAQSGDLHLRARNRLASRLVRAQQVDDVLPVLGEAIREVLGGSSAVVLAPCAVGEHLHGLHGIGELQEAAEAVELPLDAAGEPWVRAAGGTLSVGHVVMANRRTPAWFVPMGPSDAKWVLAVRTDSESTPTLLGAEMAEGLAAEAWIALQRASLVKDLADKIEILEATSRLAEVVGLDFERVAKDVTALAAAVLSCERAAIYVPDDDGKLELAHVHATDRVPDDLVAEDAGLALAQRAFEADERLLLQQDDHAPFASGPWHEDAGAVAVMGLPLRIGPRPVGALVVAHTVAQPRGFTSLCMQVGDAVAHQAALAVEHARLYAAQRDTVERLRHLDRMKADWIAGLGHDLRSPLTGLLGFVHTLQRMADQVSPEQQATFLAAMERQARRLVRLVEDLLLAAQLDGGVMAMRQDEIDLATVVATTTDILGQHERERVHVDVPAGLLVLGDHSHLERVVQNLIANGLKHGGGQVWVEGRRTDDDIRLVFSDDGPGIAPEDRLRIFERFEHGENPGSTGLGLFLAIGIAWAHGGDLYVIEGEHGGACFELTLPAA